jgi:hypothetical protein
MELNSCPTWLSQVREIKKSQKTERALSALNNAATSKEIAVAEQVLTAAILADIAAEMTVTNAMEIRENIGIMQEFSDHPKPTLLETLGLTQVSEMNGGVYHVKSNPTNGMAPVEYVALLFSPAPITPETKRILLFALPIPDPLPPDVSPLQMQAHFQSLDARRLEESGLYPVLVDLPAGTQWNKLRAIEYTRPGEAWRIRHCVQLPTGDVVCYN